MTLEGYEITQSGLVVPPSNLDCLGDECAHTQTPKGCFTDDHHLYYTDELYHTSGLIPKEMRHLPFNIIKMPRCLHDAIHQELPTVPLPNSAAMKVYLDEAQFLGTLGARRQIIREIDRRFRLVNDPNVSYRPRLLRGALDVMTRRDNMLEKRERSLEYYTRRYESLGNLSIIPQVIVERVQSELDLCHPDIIAEPPEVNFDIIAAPLGGHRLEIAA